MNKETTRNRWAMRYGIAQRRCVDQGLTRQVKSPTGTEVRPGALRDKTDLKLSNCSETTTVRGLMRRAESPPAEEEETW